MNTRELENIFDTTANRLDGIDVHSLKLQRDRVLLEDLPDENLILLPHEKERGAGKAGNMRIGLVIAIGPGDNQRECGVDEKGEVILRVRDIRFPMEVAPGDLVLFDRHKEAEIFVNGKRYGLVYQEQAILAVLPPGTKYDGVGGLKLP